MKQTKVTTETIEVEVVYADLEKVWQFPLRLALGATVGDALAKAQQHPEWPSVDIRPELLAVYGQSASFQTRLNEFDRVEILRPLLIDPMAARRGRAMPKKNKSSGK